MLLNILLFFAIGSFCAVLLVLAAAMRSSQITHTLEARDEERPARTRRDVGEQPIFTYKINDACQSQIEKG